MPSKDTIADKGAVATGVYSEAIDSNAFRHLLSHYPTGVCVVTAVDDEGPVGMVVGSFTSASLDPPLVAFFPDKMSTSWPRIERAGGYCINILSASQAELRQRFARRGGDKFFGLEMRRSPSGAAVLNGVVAWLDCTAYATHEAGDHLIALGRVTSMQVTAAEDPMLFFRGGYGTFAVSAQD